MRWPRARPTSRSSSSGSSACRSSPSTIATSRPRARRSRETTRTRSHRSSAASSAWRAPASKLLWGTANLFSHRRYMAGAATNPDPEVFAYAAAQVKKALEATHELGGANYVLWGGREGYETLLNTDLEPRAAISSAASCSLVVEHKHKIGFKGTLLIEPKPKEPTKHQYDFDAASGVRLPAPLRPRERGQGQHRGQPRHSRRPHLPARDRLRAAPTASSAAST